jgi:hypothetical protein
MARTADDFIQSVPTRTGLVGALCRLSYTVPTVDDRVYAPRLGPG